MNYKVMFVPVLRGEAQFEKEFETAAEAETALTAIALYTMFLHSCSLMEETSNIGMVLSKDADGDWVEIDGDGNPI